VLRRLGHVTEEGLVTLKGRAACEIDTADELLTAELLLNGVFNALDAHQLVALVSCLVPVDKSNARPPLRIPAGRARVLRRAQHAPPRHRTARACWQRSDGQRARPRVVLMLWQLPGLSSARSKSNAFPRLGVSPARHMTRRAW